MFINSLNAPNFNTVKQSSHLIKPQVTKPMGLSRDTVSFGMAKIPETFYKTTGLLFGLKNPEDVKSAVEGKNEFEIQSLLLEKNERGRRPAEYALLRRNIDVVRELVSLADEETKPKLISPDILKNNVAPDTVELILDIADDWTKKEILKNPSHLDDVVEDSNLKIVERIVEETDYDSLQSILTNKPVDCASEHLLKNIAALKPQTNKEDEKILNTILSKSGEEAKINMFSTAVKKDSLETAKFLFDNIGDEGKKEVLEQSEAFGFAVQHDNKEMTKFLLELSEKYGGEETKQKLIRSGANEYIEAIDSMSPELLSLLFDQADENTIAEIRDRAINNIFSCRSKTMLSSAISSGRKDLIPIIIGEKQNYLYPEEIDSIGSSILTKDIEKELFDEITAMPAVRENFRQISESLPYNTSRCVNTLISYMKENEDDQLMADVLLGAYGIPDLQFRNEARRLAMESEKISIQDSIYLLEKYGTKDDEIAVKYLKSILAKEGTEE